MNSLHHKQSARLLAFFLIFVMGILLTATAAPAQTVTPPAAAYIVQASDLETAVAAVQAVGANVTHELGIINAAGAQLTAAQKARLQADERVTSIYDDRVAEVETIGQWRRETVGMAADAWLKQQSPNEVNGTVGEMPVRTNSNDSYRAVYKFDLSSIPPNALIVSASFNVWVTQQNRGTVNVYPVTSPWTESNASWATVGNAYNSGMKVSFNPNRSNRYYSLDVASWVQKWVDGSMPDYGLMFISADSREYKLPAGSGAIAASGLI